jgi:hypothetical protein
VARSEIVDEELDALQILRGYVNKLSRMADRGLVLHLDGWAGGGDYSSLP